jgi:hypothetical protein
MLIDRGYHNFFRKFDRFLSWQAVRNRSCFFYILWWVRYYFSLTSYPDCQAVFDIALLIRDSRGRGRCGRRAPKSSSEQVPPAGFDA